MTEKYYIDTSIWMDLYFDRKGFAGEPLGTYAAGLFSMILANRMTLVITDILIHELETRFTPEEINSMINPYQKIVEKITSSKAQQEEAEQIAKERNIPRGDALHAILARDNKLTLITRDKDFRKLVDISQSQKPEDIL